MLTGIPTSPATKEIGPAAVPGEKTETAADRTRGHGGPGPRTGAPQANPLSAPATARTGPRVPAAHVLPPTRTFDDVRIPELAKVTSTEDQNLRLPWSNSMSLSGQMKKESMPSR